MNFKRIAIGRDAEEGKHEFLIRRELKIIKIDGEALSGKQGSLFFTATPSSKTPVHFLCFLGLHAHFFPLTHCIDYLWCSSSSTTLWGQGLLSRPHPPSATLLHLQLPELCLRHSRLSIKNYWMNECCNFKPKLCFSLSVLHLFLSPPFPASFQQLHIRMC